MIEKTMLYYGRHNITPDDIQQVIDVLQSDLITTGPVAAQFETLFAQYVGARHAIVVCNGSAALNLAIQAARIGPGDRVITSPNTFLASANCAPMAQAIPDFADIDPVTYNLCPQWLEENWKADTAAVIPVHYGGGSADMKSIYQIAHSRGAIVIEDACHAVGGSIESDGTTRKIGGHPWSDMTVFSFHPVKTMTTGEGGILVTDDDQLAARARMLRTHGMVRDLPQTVGLGLPDYDERGPWYYEMQELGFNYRITDFQCALGISQLSRLDQVVAQRRAIVAQYNEAFAHCDLLTIPRLRNPKEIDCTSWHLYTLLFDFEAIGKSRTEVMTELRSHGVGTQVLYIPVHLQPWYRKTWGYSAGKCPCAEQVYQKTLSLPLFPTMSPSEVQHVIGSVLSVIKPPVLSSLPRPLDPPNG